MVKATKDSEAGKMPSEEVLAAMAKFNEEMAKAGVMLDGNGLQPSSKGARVTFSGHKRTVIDGPFADQGAQRSHTVGCGHQYTQQLQSLRGQLSREALLGGSSLHKVARLRHSWENRPNPAWLFSSGIASTSLCSGLIHQSRKPFARFKQNTQRFERWL
jgi:YCII-related domain